MPLTRRLILQKARHHPTPPQGRHKALTDCRRTVSGTISLPSRGTFHHSLTVLVRYRSPGSIQPYQVVLADSRQIPGVHRYSGISTGRPAVFAYRTLTVYGRLSHTIRLTTSFITPRETVRPPTRNPTTPHTQPLTSIPRTRFRLLRFRSPLLTESHLFSLPTGTEMFHFPAFPPTPYEFRCR